MLSSCTCKCPWTVIWLVKPDLPFPNKSDFTMPHNYVFFYLELALRDKKDLKIYAFENISHIPTDKLIEIFEIKLDRDPYLLEGYFLKRRQYKKHKKYIKETIGAINLDLFKYTLRQYSASDFKEV